MYKKLCYSDTRVKFLLKGSEKMIEENGNGSVRKTKAGTYECIIQSKIINPNTGKELRVKRTRKTRQEAEKAAKLAIKAEIKRIQNEENYKMSNTMTFGEYCTDYLAKVVKKEVSDGSYYRYVQQYRQYISKYSIARYQAHQLSKRLFEIYYEKLTLKYSPKSISFPIQLCKRVCKWLVERSIIEENYAEQARVIYEKVDDFTYVEERKHKEIFTVEDLQKFYKAYQQNLTEYACVVVFMLETGLRPQEFANIKNSDISFEKRLLHISKSTGRRFVDDTDTKTELYTKITKTCKERDVYLSDIAIEAIETMQAYTKSKCKDNKNDLLYPIFKNGRVRSNATMEVGFKLLCDKLEIDRDVHPTKGGQIKGLNLYALRHTCDTMMHASGANPVISAAMLGHSATTSLREYTHIQPEMQAELKTPFQAISNQENEEKKEELNLTEEDEKRLLKMLLNKYKDKLDDL